jgi:aldehyde dehydrogenase (NAD+)
MKDISNSIAKLRDFYDIQETKSIEFRISMLKRLQASVVSNEKAIIKAMQDDLGKSEFESYASEIGLFYQEIRLHIRKLEKWAKPVRVRTPVYSFPAKSIVYSEPYGVVLIIAPWNYPFLLFMVPLVGAISAGNCIACKPAHYSEHTSAVLDRILCETFDERYLSVFTGGRDVIESLLNERFDYIFFTGGAILGKFVMEKASKNLTPVTLELGGKSPCIVDRDADIALATRRIAWGKLLNTGQTCVCPDYAIVHTSVKESFLRELKVRVEEFYSSEPEKSEDYGRIINDKRWLKIKDTLDKTDARKVFLRGTEKREEKLISPVILTDVKANDPVMEDEVFGPVLPVMTFDDIGEVIRFVNSRFRPLALYYFGRNESVQARIVREVSFGGGCINDTVLHFSNPNLPFGGIGESGMGAYHGKRTFDTFTHYKSIMKNSNLIDLPFRYPPYKNKLSLIRMILK